MKHKDLSILSRLDRPVTDCRSLACLKAPARGCELSIRLWRDDKMLEPSAVSIDAADVAEHLIRHTAKCVVVKAQVSGVTVFVIAKGVLPNRRAAGIHL